MHDADYSILEHQGCRLAYRVQGEGPPVLLLQGIGVPGAGWRPQVESLAQRYRCLSFDNRGMGASQPIGRRISVEQMADDAEALLDSQGWRSAHVVGHSLGALVALHLALSAPERIRSLSLLSAVARGRDAARLTWPILKLGVVSTVGTPRMRRNAFLQLVMPRHLLTQNGRDELAKSLEPVFGRDLADQPAVVNHQLQALRAYDATGRLAALEGIPTLVVSAGQDPIAPPRFGKQLAAALPQARFVEIPKAAHGFTVQCAEHLNALLVENFLISEAASRCGPSNSSTSRPGLTSATEGVDNEKRSGKKE